MFSAGDTDVIKRVLQKLVAMRTFMRYKELDKSYDPDVLKNAGLTEQVAEEMYKLSAIAKYDDRYVIPKSHREEAGDMFNYQGSAGYEFMVACRGCLRGDQMNEASLDYDASGFWGESNEQVTKEI